MVYDALGSQLHGELLEPGSTAYDTAEWSGMESSTVGPPPSPVAETRPTSWHA